MSEKNESNISSLSAQEAHEIKDDNGMYKFHYYANDIVGIEVAKKTYEARRYDRNRLRTMLKNIDRSINDLQSASEYFFNTSGQYQRMIRYSAGYFTYDHILVPMVDQKKFDSNPDKLWVQFDKCAMYLKMINPKFLCWYVVMRLLTIGEVYLYIIKDKKGIIYKELPAKYCRVAYSEDGVHRFEFNIAKIDKTLAEQLPKKLMKAWESNQKKQSKDKVDWLPIEKDGVAFNYFGSRSKGFPPFCYMFESIEYYFDALDNYEDTSKLDSMKMVHQKIPLDDNHKPVLNREQVAGYHNATKKGLPRLMSVSTNPFDVQTLNFDKAASRQKDFVEVAEMALYDASGFSKQLFNNTFSSGEGLKKSIIADQTSIKHIVDMVEQYVNYELKQVNKAYPFAIKILDTTVFNIEDRHAKAREDLAYGGSRMVFMATQNLDPLESMNIVRFEQAVGLDKYFVPAQTSHTQTDQTSPEESGSKTKEEVSDAGDLSREYK